jgi:hypothetical protein
LALASPLLASNLEARGRCEAFARLTPNAEFSSAKTRKLFGVSCTGLILIQASSAAMCGGKVAVIKRFTPKEEAGDELLSPTA